MCGPKSKDGVPAPGRPKPGTAPPGLEPAAPSLLEQGWTGDRGEASREPRPARPRAAHEMAGPGTSGSEERKGAIQLPQLEG